jgi:iron complex transport system substrate-binding protein
MRLVFLAGLFYFERPIEMTSLPSKLCAPSKPEAIHRKYRPAPFYTGIAAALFLMLLPGGTIAAQADAPRSALSASRTLVDELGRKVQIPQHADRVVSLAPNLTEIVFALGDEDHLAGDTNFCDYPPEALQKPHVGGMQNPSLDAIVALKPDLVLATKAINLRGTVDALDRIGVPVYVTDAPHSLEDMIVSIEHVGAALGMEKSAAEVSGRLRQRLSDLDRRLTGTAPRRVFFVVQTAPVISAGRNTFIADALRHAGGRSIIETSAEWPHISLEAIVHLQPEFLIFASAHAGETQRDIEDLRSNPGWRDLKAIQEGKIVVLSDAINRPAPRLVDAVEQLARALHPEVFASRGEPVPISLAITEEDACKCNR